MDASVPVRRALVLVVLLAAPVAVADGLGFERVMTSTMVSTRRGTTLLAPAGWRVRTARLGLSLETEEGDTRISITDVRQRSAEKAVTFAWRLARGGPGPSRTFVASFPGLRGWDEGRVIGHLPSSDHTRLRWTIALRRGLRWSVMIVETTPRDLAHRLAELRAIGDNLRPARVTPERRARPRRRARELDAPAVTSLLDFVREGRAELGIPGIGVGLYSRGRAVYEGAVGVRALGSNAEVTSRTLFLAGSATLPLTTLMLGKLVDEGHFTWETPVDELVPRFQLQKTDAEACMRCYPCCGGDTGCVASCVCECLGALPSGRTCPASHSSAGCAFSPELAELEEKATALKQLVCGCTEIPSGDLEWFFEFENAREAHELRLLGEMLPELRGGETFDISEILAAAAGYMGGQRVYSMKKPGPAFDLVMDTRLFRPLEMKTATFSFEQALAREHADPHAEAFDGTTAIAEQAPNRALIPLRPAAGAWVSVEDLGRVVQLELAGGTLPDGTRHVTRRQLARRRRTEIRTGERSSFGLGLAVDRSEGVEVVHVAGGGAFGYESDVIFLPEHGVGAVLLTNSESGAELVEPFRRKLVQVLFGGDDEPERELHAGAALRRETQAAAREGWAFPATEAVVSLLAGEYRSPTLGGLRVVRDGEFTVLDFGEWHSRVASRDEGDGTASLVTVDPGVSGHELVLGEGSQGRVLALRDSRRPHVFAEVAAR